jgi:uncharacterized protein
VDFHNWQWCFLALAAFCVGLSKTGIAGLGILPVALFANVMSARESTGALLPLLLAGDVFGVAFYRKHADWTHLWKLFPWVVLGVISGFVTLGRVTSVDGLIGWILLIMIFVHTWRQRQSDRVGELMPHTWWFAALTGILAGFTTMVANAAGPVMLLYLLAVGLPKLAFIGTGAWFFMLVNALKVPFSLKLGLITQHSLLVDAILLAPMIPGAMLGPIILRRINQRVFELMVLGFTALAALRLVF